MATFQVVAFSKIDNIKDGISFGQDEFELLWDNSGRDPARQLGETSELLANIWGTITIGLGHWSREMSSPNKDIGEKIVVDGLLENTNN